jgi:hypothetical protein
MNWSILSFSMRSKSSGFSVGKSITPKDIIALYAGAEKSR